MHFPGPLLGDLVQTRQVSLVVQLLLQLVERAAVHYIYCHRKKDQGRPARSVTDSFEPIDCGRLNFELLPEPTSPIHRCDWTAG